MKKIWMPIITGLLSFCFVAYGFEKPTHMAVNINIATKSINGFSLDSYLTNQLGLSKGVKEEFNGKQIMNWIGEGGKAEDEPEGLFKYLSNNARNNNHFHNPLADTWDKAGLDIDVSVLKSLFPLLFRLPYPFPDHIKGQSSILWAHNKNQDPGGKWSWYDARDYFYKGLTLTDKTQRDSTMANCFRALGQLMHLIQDASVPAHVRGEFHFLTFHYEKWLEAMRSSNSEKDRQRFNDFIASPSFFDRSILDGSPNPLPFISGFELTPIARIIDTDQYNGNNPEVTVTRPVGIAEFTNANFFGEFIYPPFAPKCSSPDLKSPNVEERVYDLQDPRDPKKTVTRKYYYRKIDEAGNGYRLATVGFLKDYITKYFPSYIGLLRPALDGGVYNDYAEKLIPRAVGYSAGLLQYFFRGNLYIGFLVPSVDQAIYNVSNANDTGRDIDTVAFFIQNNSKLNDVIEPIGEGTISLTVSYIDSRAGETVYQSAGTGSVTNIPDMGSENVLTALFTLAEPIPTQFAKELTYYLTFRGELGQEKDAVIGKVIKAPVLQYVSPDQGIEGTLVTIIGDYLPEIGGPFPTTSRNVNFNHDTRWPYTAEVISRTDTEITAKVPNSAAIVKPGYGGLRVRRVVSETEEMIYSNPVPFFPIAEGEIRNSGKASINATIEAVKPILGDYNQLPGPIIYPVLPGQSVSLQLMTGFTYKATTNTSFTQDIWTLTPDPMDFVFDLE